MYELLIFGAVEMQMMNYSFWHILQNIIKLSASDVLKVR